MEKTLTSIWNSLRPKQWTKNVVVFAAPIFALGDRTQPHLNVSTLWISLAATVIFCMISSAVYLLNDIHDLKSDQAHPTKRFRPLAAGEISIPLARFILFILVVIGFTAAWRIGVPLFEVILAYFILQIFYTFILKKIALVDLFIIAIGFVLRALAGAVAISVTISPWLLLCTLLLALFLALCKRRHDIVVIADTEGTTRTSLRNYNERLLDQLISMIGAATLVCYSFYTLAPDTVEKFGTTHLGFTIPFVIFGLFRYLDLVYRHEKGGRPEQILLTDIPLLINLLLYGVCVAVILLA